MAERVCRYRRAIGAMVAVATLFVVLFVLTPQHGSATEITRSGSANQHQTVHRDSTALVVRTTTATHREHVRVGDWVLLGGVAGLVLVALAGPHRRRAPAGAQLSRVVHSRAPPLFLTSV